MYKERHKGRKRACLKLFEIGENLPHSLDIEQRVLEAEKLEISFSGHNFRLICFPLGTMW